MFEVEVNEAQYEKPSITATPSVDDSKNVVHIEFTPENCEQAVVLAALYSKGVLVGIEYINYDVNDSVTNIDIPFEIKPDEVKVMLWNNLKELVPLCENETITISE